MSNPKVILIFCVLALLLGGILYLVYPTPQEYGQIPNKPEEPVLCTMDAKQCSDGSYVGRSGPKCEFAPCPIPPGVMMEDGVINDARPPRIRESVAGGEDGTISASTTLGQ